MLWSYCMSRDRPLLTSEDILAQLKFIRNKKQEYFVCLSLDNGSRLIARRVVTIGLLGTGLVHPREVFAAPLKDHATAVIVAHNHPSGDPEPSDQDIKATSQLVSAGIILGIPLRDHIIVSKEGHYSFAVRYMI